MEENHEIAKGKNGNTEHELREGKTKRRRGNCSKVIQLNHRKGNHKIYQNSTISSVYRNINYLTVLKN